jgi:HAD superfamily hydrolase (TIGR01549 family)
MVIKVAIFDIDGTLLDSVDLHAQAWQQAFKHFGRDIPFEKVRQQIGKGGDQLMPVFFTRKELDEFGDEIEKFRGKLFKREFLPRVRPFHKERELFQHVLGDGKKIVLGSSAKEDEVEVYKKIAHIEDLIEEETSSDDAEKSKPHPDILEAALEKLHNISRDQVMVVGDTPYDAEAAGRARLRTIGFLCGGFPEAELRSAGCIAIYQGPADLLARYADSPLA